MLILLSNGQNIAAYKYTGLWAFHSLILEGRVLAIPSFEAGMHKLTNHNYYVFKKANKQVLRKLCNFTVNRDRGYKKVRNKGGSLHLQIF